MSKTGRRFQRMVVFVLCGWALLSAGIQRVEAQAPVGMSEITHCVDGEEIECQQMKVISLPVSYGLGQTVDLTEINTLNDPAGGTGMDESVGLEIGKTMPKLQYPLAYFHTVFYYPHEEVIIVQDASGCGQECVDHPNADCPTCGWTYMGGGRVEHSQGFCNSNIQDAATSWWRGKALFADDPNILDNPFSTAHCLRMGEVTYHGYEIGRYHKDYQIEFLMTIGDETHEFVLATNDPAYNTRYDDSYYGSFHLAAHLLGDLDANPGYPELGNYILYVPAGPESHPLVQDPLASMLLVPREETSRSGDEADKVGVNFYAFRSLAARAAKSRAGDGLHNQLHHKYQSDLTRMAVTPDRDMTYLVQGKRPFKGSMSFAASAERILEVDVPQIDYSLISLTADVGNMKAIYTEAAGRIVYAEAMTFYSLSTDGVLEVRIENGGNKKANYIVAVKDCSSNIVQPIPAQARRLASGEWKDLTFDLYTMTNVPGANRCYVYLESPNGRVYDAARVDFDTVPYGIAYPGELRSENEGSELNYAQGDVLGDMNEDGKVDMDDLGWLSDNWLTPTEQGFIDMGEFGFVSQCWQVGVVN